MKNTKTLHSRVSKRLKPGFALVATISVMVLLVMVALAMLSLTTLETRATNQAQSQQEAQANARVALMVALGHLQTTMGRDQFVSAPASILNNSSGSTGGPAQHYTGVWAARENPRNNSSDDALGKTPSYDSSTAFVEWLVSNKERNLLTDESSQLADQFLDPIEMVGEGSAESDGRVLAGRIPLTKGVGQSGGKYAWWIGENATKALVRTTDDAMRQGQNRAQALLASATPGAHGAEAITDLNLRANTEESDRLLSLQTTGLLQGLDGSVITSDKVKRHFHDITHHANSLLTNVTTGGLRKDLSLFFEGNPEQGSWTGSIIEGNAPIGPYGEDSLSPRDEYDVGHWKSLRQHYAIHKTAASSSNGLIGGTFGQTLNAVDDINPISKDHPYPSWNFQRKSLKPILVRMSYVLSLGVQDASRGRVSKEDLQKIQPRTKLYDEVNNKYLVTFHAFPVVCLWNPYSQNLQCPGFSIGNMGMSVEHDVQIGGSPSLDYQWTVYNSKFNSTGYHVHGMNVDRPFTLSPGEVKMFFATQENFKHSGSHQYYTRGTNASQPSDIAFDGSPGSGLFSAGIVQNGVIGNTFDSGNGNYSGWEILTGLFGNLNDTITIDTNIYTPQGSRNSGPREDYNGLIYYATYSSMDVRMTTRSFSNWRTPALWWTQWGAGRQRERASKWTNKIGWRNDNSNPVVLGQPIQAVANIADLASGRKQPYMVIDLRLKSTGGDPDERNPNLVWLHNIPGHGFSGCSGQTTPGVEVANAGNIVTESHSRPYTVVYNPVQSANEAWNILQLDSIEGELRSYMGNSYYPDGQHKAVAMEVPVAPLQSIAQLQHVPQVPTDATRWSGLSLQNYAIGNSYANPHIPADQIKRTGWNIWLDNRIDNADNRTNQLPDLDGKKWYTTTNGEGPATEHFKPTQHLDRSYAANTLLWDDFFFSGMARQTGSYFRQALGGRDRSLNSVVTQFVNNAQALPNARYVPNLLQKDPATLTSELLGEDNYRMAAAHINVVGGFNVNSTSQAAWKAFLASNLRKKLVTLATTGSPNSTMEESTATEYIINRYSLSNGEAHNSSSNSNQKWLGYRTINEDDLDDLAKKMVEQVKLRGPFRSIGEFINRRLEDNSDLALRGALQAAIDNSSVNAEFAGDTIGRGEISSTDYAYEDAALLSRHAGTPPYVMQGDLLQTVGSLIQVRSDTFTIRAYGESADGKGKAWCEAIVQRSPNWIDSNDPAEKEFDDLLPINKAFGRRLRIVSFRWLSPSEV